jgi:hypothetical protein
MEAWAGKGREGRDIKIDRIKKQTAEHEARRVGKRVAISQGLVA